MSDKDFYEPTLKASELKAMEALVEAALDVRKVDRSLRLQQRDETLKEALESPGRFVKGRP